MQILGNLYPHNPAKAHRAVSHFKEAAGRSDKDPEVWEMLGELLAPTDPSGLLQCLCELVGCSMGHSVGSLSPTGSYARKRQVSVALFMLSPRAGNLR